MNPPAAADTRPEMPEALAQALGAMNEGRDADAIGILQRGLEADPANGLLHFLLGSLFAQSGMIDRAVVEMTLAVEHAPQLHMARFQLGLLHFTSMNVAAAQVAWEPLSALPADDPLVLFRSGMLHLARDEFEACIDDLRRGIATNTSPPALNGNMAMVIEKAQAAIAARDAAPAESGQHVLLAGYQALKPAAE